MPIELEKTGHIATLTLNRPEKLNALTVEMLLQMEQHLLALSRDSDMRVLLIKPFWIFSSCSPWRSGNFGAIHLVINLRTV